MTDAPSRLPAAERRLALIETAIRVFSEGATAARRRRRSPVRRASPSRSSTATSRRSASSTSPRSTTCGARRGPSWEGALATTRERARGVRGDGPRPRRRSATASSRWRSSGCRRSSEATEDPELRKHLRRHMREVHDFVAAVIRRGQEEGVLHADRNADAEAWTFLAGGVLGMVGRRVGLLDEDEVQAIRSSPPGLADRVERRSERLWRGAEPARAQRRDRALRRSAPNGGVTRAPPRCGGSREPTKASLFNEKGPGCGSGALLRGRAHPVRGFGSSALRPSRASCPPPDVPARPLQT